MLALFYLSFIRENGQDFQSWNSSGIVYNEWNKYTFRKYLWIQEQGRKTGNQAPAQAHVAGLGEEFHAQTWKTNTPWSYSTKTRAGKGKPEQHFTSSVHSDLPSAQQFVPWLVLHRGRFPKGHQPWYASNAGTDGRIHGWEFSFPQSPSGYSSNTGQEIFFSVPVATCHHGKCCALLHLVQFSHPVPYKTSYKQGKFSYWTVILLSPLLFHGLQFKLAIHIKNTRNAFWQLVWCHYMQSDVL